MVRNTLQMHTFTSQVLFLSVDQEEQLKVYDYYETNHNMNQ